MYYDKEKYLANAKAIKEMLDSRALSNWSLTIRYSGVNYSEKIENIC